jgi:hypothetical protein
MSNMTDSEGFIFRKLSHLREFQESYRVPISDISRQSPVNALHSLRDAAKKAPASYQDYLSEAIDCYENGAYRGAVLMVWTAVIEHLYSIIDQRRNGFKELEKTNFTRFGTSKAYRKIGKKDDLLYLSDRNFIQLCEDAGLFNRNARLLLIERLDLRNRCGHPTGYTVGRDEAVVFIESLLNNIVGGAMLNWKLRPSRSRRLR